MRADILGVEGRSGVLVCPSDLLTTTKGAQGMLGRSTMQWLEACSFWSSLPTLLALFSVAYRLSGQYQVRAIALQTVLLMPLAGEQLLGARLWTLRTWLLLKAITS